MRLLPLLLLLVFSSLAQAQAQNQDLEAALPPPPMNDSPDTPELKSAPPPTVETTIEREPQEPEVRIIERKDKTVTEYRENGVVYMVKITPSVGPSYYLIDSDGDGDLETRQSDLDPDMAVPTWVIKRW
jgi:hypothetical protein